MSLIHYKAVFFKRLILNLSVGYSVSVTVKHRSELMREFSASWHFVLVFQNKHDLKCC